MGTTITNMEPVVWYENTEEHRRENLRHNQIVWLKVRDIPDPALAIYQKQEDKFLIDLENDEHQWVMNVTWFTAPVAPQTINLTEDN